MDTIHPSSSSSRRALLLGLLGGLAATVASALGRPTRVQAGHDGTNVMHLGEENVSPDGAGTHITNGHLVVRGLESGTETGFPGVWGIANAGIGVVGTSWDGGGVVGAGGSIQKDPELRPPGPGVIGYAPGAAPGVLALSASDGNEALGEPGPPDGGLALDVVGAARFSTAGSATVAQGSNSATVANAAVTADSHISVAIVSDPGSRVLRWIERDPGSGFTAHFEGGGKPSTRPATDLTYLIVEPPV